MEIIKCKKCKSEIAIDENTIYPIDCDCGNAINKMEQCEACKDEGFLIAMNTNRDHLEVEKCDLCNKFKSDKEAWKYLKPKH